MIMMTIHDIGTKDHRGMRTNGNSSCEEEERFGLHKLECIETAKKVWRLPGKFLTFLKVCSLSLSFSECLESFQTALSGLEPWLCIFAHSYVSLSQ